MAVEVGSKHAFPVFEAVYTVEVVVFYNVGDLCVLLWILLLVFLLQVDFKAVLWLNGCRRFL